MLTKLRNRMAREESGFTLIELLVVMLILGILAAIAIPSFFAQRDKARDADAKSAVRTAQTAMETLATDHQNGLYQTATNADPVAADLVAIEETLGSLPAGALTISVPGANDEYSVQVDSDTNNAFRISRTATGTVTLTCGDDTTLVTAAFAGGGGDGGCRSDETW